MEQVFEQVKNKIEEVFDKDKLDQAAKETGFIQRSTSKLEGIDFVKIMSLGFLENAEISLEGLCDILQQINPEAKMSPQGLNQRINSEEAVKFLEEVLKDALQKNIEAVSDDNSLELLSSFDRVLIEDSTQCTLNEKLAEEFKGSGGSASKSAVKIDLIYELKQNAILKIIITKGAEPDQALSGKILDGIQPNDLILRDLGFFKIDILAAIHDSGAFYLSRLPKGVNIFLSDSEDASPINLPRYLIENFPYNTEIDLDIYIGNNKMPCRLIAYKLPEEIADLRRRKARQAARKKGKTVSQDYLKWLDFGFYIANVSKDIWPAGVAGTIYRLRWQVELIFKAWKSLLNIHILRGSRPERIKCLIYGRLITITVMTMIYGHTFRYAINQFGREVSTMKLFSWLKRNGRLLKAIHTESLEGLLNDLIKNISRVCKQKRTRKTSLQLLEDKVKYLDSFSSNEIKRMQQKNNVSEIINKISDPLLLYFNVLELVLGGIVCCLEILHFKKIV